jgi:hypothetical protein
MRPDGSLCADIVACRWMHAILPRSGCITRGNGSSEIPLAVLQVDPYGDASGQEAWSNRTWSSDFVQPNFLKVTDDVRLFPSERASYFVSIVPAMSVIEGLCVELALVDPARTTVSIQHSRRNGWPSITCVPAEATSRAPGGRACPSLP